VTDWPRTLDRDPTAGMVTEHPAGCTYGGFSCGYWLVSEGCPLEHWERHLVLEHGRCPCGTVYPGAASMVVFVDATDPNSSGE